MQIYCPKCNACYQIDEKLIADKARKVKCSACGETFIAGELKEAESQEDIFAAISAAMTDSETDMPKVEEKTPQNDIKETVSTEETVASRDLGDGRIEPSFSDTPDMTANSDNPTADSDGGNKTEETDEAEEDGEGNVDLEKIFERLSEHTEHLIAAEKKLPFYEKAWLQIKNALGFHFKVKWSYIFVALTAFVLLSAYNNRYQIVRDVPFLNNVYKAVGIKAKIAGEGLEFQNIGWDFVKDEEGARLIVKGFIYNLTDRNIALPVIHIEILDKETGLLQSHNREIKETEVPAATKIPLSLTLANPAPTAKYVYLTFIDKD